MFEQVGEIEAKVQKILDLCLERRTHTSDEPGADPARNSPVQRPDSLALPLKPILVLDRGHDVATTESDDHLAEQQEQQQQQHQPSPVKKRVTLCQQWRATFFLFGLLVMCVCVCVLFFFFLSIARMLPIYRYLLPFPPSSSVHREEIQSNSFIAAWVIDLFLPAGRAHAPASVDRFHPKSCVVGGRQADPAALYIYIYHRPPPHPLLARPASPDYRAIDRQLTPGSAVAVLLAAPERHAKYQ